MILGVHHPISQKFRALKRKFLPAPLHCLTLPTYLVMQWGPTGAAAQVQGLSSTGGHRWWDGCQGLGFRAEFWVLRRKPLVATCEGEEWFRLVEEGGQTRRAVGSVCATRWRCGYSDKGCRAFSQSGLFDQRASWRTEGC